MRRLFATQVHHQEFQDSAEQMLADLIGKSLISELRRREQPSYVRIEVTSENAGFDYGDMLKTTMEVQVARSGGRCIRCGAPAHPLEDICSICENI